MLHRQDSVQNAEGREDNVYRAKLAEQAERYEEMIEAINKIAKGNTDLSVEERNLFSVAYKNVTGARRASWRIVSNLEGTGDGRVSQGTGDGRVSQGTGDGRVSQGKKILTKQFKIQIESELRGLCLEALDIINTHLNPHATTIESKVFYFKMKGDYYRYLAEVAGGTDKEEAADNSSVAYDTASNLFMTGLPPTHPTRLGLALSYSVFYYEILNSPERACRLAKKAFDDALAELDTLNDENYKDSTLIMQLLRDNLSLWTTDGQARGGRQQQIQGVEGEDTEGGGQQQGVEGQDTEGGGQQQGVEGEDTEGGGQQQDVEGEDTEGGGQQQDVEGEDTGGGGQQQGVEGEDTEGGGQQQDVEGEDTEGGGQQQDVEGEDTEGGGQQQDVEGEDTEGGGQQQGVEGEGVS